MCKPLTVAIVAVLLCAACDKEKAKLEQQQHDQAIAAAAASSAAAAQAEKDKDTTAAAASQAAVQAAALQAQRDTTDRAKAAADLRSDVQANPGKYLQVTNSQAYDKGLINSYRQLTSLTLLNKSSFALTDLKGSVDWEDASGASTGTTPFTLVGSIPAGATLTFSTANGTMTSGTLQTKTNKTQIKFTHATIVAP
jgi:hypothetical protein